MEINYNDKKIIMFIQKYIPMILENEIYFKIYVDYLLKKYDFEVIKEHLQKKLNIFLTNSFRNDSVRLSPQLVRGEYQSGDHQESWIWLTSKAIGEIAYYVVEYIVQDDEDNPNIMNDNLVGET